MASRTATADAERRWLRVLSTLNEAQARLFGAEEPVGLTIKRLILKGQDFGSNDPTR